MQKNPGDERPQWIPLREACLILGVNETTLRYWADGGKVRAFRTPGGHRRFSIADLHAITQGTHSAHPPLGDHVLGDAALMRIRRRLQQSKSSKLGWVDAAGEKGRLRLRPLGRRLLHLVGDYLRQRRGRAALLEEARAIGAEHGEEAAHLGLGFKDAFQAFVFFRNSVLDMIAQGTKKDEGTQAGAQLEQWRQVLALMDEVEMAVAEAYQKHSMILQGHAEKATRFGA